MALTVTNLHTQLAYRLGETSAPTDSTTLAIRLEWMNQAYFDIARRMNWWWLEGTDTTNTNTGSTTGYSEPSDLKEFIELKIGNIFYDQIPMPNNRIYSGTSHIVSLPQNSQSRKFYRFGGKYYLIPTDNANGTAHTIKYFKRVTKRSSGSDTFLIPDEYLEALVAFAEARYWMSITQQAKAQVPFQEYEAIIESMTKEQNRRGWGWGDYGMRDPEDPL